MEIELSYNEKKEIKTWLKKAFSAASAFDGSEASEKKFYLPLQLFDDFVRAHNQDQSSRDLEQQVARISFPDHPIEMPETVDDFLDIASSLYKRLKSYENSTDIFDALKKAGAIIQESDKVFVKTDNGQINLGTSDNPNSFEVKTQPRLAMLIAHLRNEGVNKQPIYMDDLVIISGKNDANMVREFPYNIVQIPRLDIEVSLCDQVGEITFVKKGTIGETFWDHMSKNDLKEREDVWPVRFNDEEQWWNKISEVLSGNAQPTAKKVNVKNWSNRKKINLDIGLIKESLLAHHKETGEWLSNGKRDENGKIGSYVLEHGPYAGQITAANLNAALTRNGSRGLSGKSSVAQLNEEISNENGFDYVNLLSQDNLDIGLIKESLLAHHEETGEWLSANKLGEDDKKGNYALEHGPYAGQITVANLNQALVIGLRGLSGKSSVAQLNEEISNENGLDYVNHLTQDNLDIDLIKESLLAHHEETGEWLSASKIGNDNKAYVLEYGPYARQMSVKMLDSNLRIDGLRGLSGKSSVAQLNEEISNENGLDYVNRGDQAHLDIEFIKESLLAHHEETGEWLSASKLGEDDKKGSYVLEHGPYARQITVTNLNAALMKDGARGLSGKSSVAQLNEEISNENGFDYVNLLTQDNLDIDLIKESLLAHYEETGEWLSASKIGNNNKAYVLEYGPHAGQMTVSAIESALMKDGVRGLSGKSSVAQLNEEISNENDLNYVNRKNLDNLDIDLIKESLLAHYEETSEWLSVYKKREGGKEGSYILEHGHYAGQMTVSSLENSLRRDGERGLSGKSSVAQLNEEISNENGLDYVNRGDQAHLDIELIKESLLAHHEETGEWLSSGKIGDDDKKGSYVLKHGLYTGQITVGALNAALMKDGARGLSGKSSIYKINNVLKEKLAYEQDSNLDNSIVFMPE